MGKRGSRLGFLSLSFTYFCDTTLDHGYHPDTITPALQKLYPQMMTKIRFELAPKPTSAEKAAQGHSGFVPVATRWGKRAV